jgi:hypothetical protein
MSRPSTRERARVATPEVHLSRSRDLVGRFGAAILWLAAVLAIGLGTAGVVAGFDTPAADGSDRTGRTARGDAIVTHALDAVAVEMTALAGSIDELGQHGRGLLAALSTNDVATAEAASTAGSRVLADIEGRAGRVRADLHAVPIIGTVSAEYALSPAVREREIAYLGAMGSVETVGPAWTRLTVGSLSATRLSALLADHDRAAAAAAERGRAADYATALGHLDDADAAIRQSRALRDKLAGTVDVSTLDQWLDRSAAYDKALRALYDAVRASGGRTTDAVRSAVAAEEAAKHRLPPDTRALVLIMADIGRGGMTGAEVDIEQAHEDVVEALRPPSGVGP